MTGTKTNAKATSPLIQSGRFVRKSDGRTCAASQFPSTNWSVVFDDGERIPVMFDAEFDAGYEAAQ